MNPGSAQSPATMTRLPSRVNSRGNDSRPGNRELEGSYVNTNGTTTTTVPTGFDVDAQLSSVMCDLGLTPKDTGGTITFVGEDPIFPSVHRLGACIGIPITG